MPDERKRIINQDTDTSLSSGDFVIVDSQAEGSRKFDLGSELSSIKQDLSQLEEYEIYVQGTSLIINTNLINGNEVEY